MIEKILRLLYPPKCAFCRRLLRENENGICSKCRRETVFLCGKEGRQIFTNIDLCLSPLYYAGNVKESLQRYKFSSLTGYASVYADIIISCISYEEIKSDMITWVPLSRKRLRKRGYDQAKLLADELSARTGIPCVRTLNKVKNTRPQSKTGGMNRRRENIQDAYEIVSHEAVAGKKILIVDDIVTTGATLSECAGVLKKEGASRVTAITVARRKE